MEDGYFNEVEGGEEEELSDEENVKDEEDEEDSMVDEDDLMSPVAEIDEQVQPNTPL